MNLVSDRFQAFSLGGKLSRCLVGGRGTKSKLLSTDILRKFGTFLFPCFFISGTRSGYQNPNKQSSPRSFGDAVANRFAPLASSDASPPAATNAPTTRRPPAIRVYNILNVRYFTKRHETAIKSQDFTVQRLGPSAPKNAADAGKIDDTCRVSLKTREKYDLAKSFLQQAKMAYSTWDDKRERSQSYVIQGLSSDT